MMEQMTIDNYIHNVTAALPQNYFKIENYIPVGRENAVSRIRLSEITGLSDRGNRREIEQARCRGVIIINLQDGVGYYRSDDVDEMHKQYKQNENRAMSVLVQQKFLRSRLRAAGRTV